MFTSTFARLPNSLRLAGVVAGSASTCCVLGGLVLAWGSLAPPNWIAATPAVLAEVAVCNKAQDREARTQCKHAIVLAHASQPVALVVASR